MCFQTDHGCIAPQLWHDLFQATRSREIQATSLQLPPYGGRDLAAATVRRMLHVPVQTLLDRSVSVELVQGMPLSICSHPSLVISPRSAIFGTPVSASMGQEHWQFRISQDASGGSPQDEFLYAAPPVGAHHQHIRPMFQGRSLQRISDGGRSTGL